MTKKNFFLQSFKHLEQQKEAGERIESVDSSVEMEREDISDSEESEHVVKENKKNPYAIYLGKGQIFLNPDVAYQNLLNLSIKELPSRYRNSLTKAFFNGTEIGQINTLYKDWKKYKGGIFPKISEYFAYIKNNSDKCPVGKKYAGYIIANYAPTCPETFSEGAVDLWFFKFWVLFKFYVSNGK